MAQVWSDKLGKYVNEEKKDYLERINNGNQQEQQMSQGVLDGGKDRFKKLKKLFGK